MGLSFASFTVALQPLSTRRARSLSLLSSFLSPSASSSGSQIVLTINKSLVRIAASSSSALA
jgi:hypothetical protein